MIVIDGRQSSMDLKSFANLEEVLVKVMEEEVVAGNIVTDVLVNETAFSEIYPHHAEDVTIDEVQRVELHTVSTSEMAAEVSKELHIVIKIMQDGSKGVAMRLRQGDTGEGMELLQDLLDVVRNFLGTISVLHQRFPLESTEAFEKTSVTLDSLLSEMCDVMGNQDWLLLADLLQYELAPACEEWSKIIDAFQADIESERVV